MPLAGAVLFLVCQRRGQDGRAGAASVLLAIKPHLVLLFWLALVPWAVAQRRWRLLAGAALAILAATTVALWCNPAVLGQYLDLMAHRPPEMYRTPTLGTLLREAWGDGPFWLQYLSLVPGLIWLVPYGLRHCRDWDWGQQLPLLLLVSLLCAPYGAWPFDLVLLLVPLLRVAARVTGRPESAPLQGAAQAGLAAYLIINGAAGVLVARFIHFFWFGWMTPALLLAYLGMEHHRVGASPKCAAAAHSTGRQAVG
jgi:hypothetical protein